MNREEAKKKAERRAALLEINKLAAGYFYYQLRRESGRQAHEYLTGRGLSEETIRKFGLGYSDMYNNGASDNIDSREKLRLSKEAGYREGKILFQRKVERHIEEKHSPSSRRRFPAISRVFWRFRQYDGIFAS